jgi:signal peptidase II
MSEENTQETSTQAPSIQEPAAKPKLLRQWGLLIAVSGGILLIDQTAKMLVLERLLLGHSWVPIPQIGDFIRITRSYNTGAAFGMLPQASDIFLLLAMITIIAFIISYPQLPSKAWLSRLSIAMISGGALSNAIDRIRHGHVVDYVHVQLTSTLSNISNFADHAITVGVVLLLVDQWLTERREKQQQVAQAEEKVDGDVSQPPDVLVIE